MASTPAFRSSATEAVHSSARAMFEVGVIDEATMREFDVTCLVPQIATKNLDSGAPLSPEAAENLQAYALADRLYQKKQYRRALKLFKRAALADPTDGDAFHAIGSCHDMLGQPARAASAYLNALILSPAEKHPDLHFNIGNAYFDLHLYEQALAEYGKVPKSSPIWPLAQRNADRATERMNPNADAKRVNQSQ